MFGVTEETYLSQKGVFLEALKSVQVKAGPEASPSGADSAAQSPRTTLPRIELPQFSGQYEDWPSFRDLFQSFIWRDVETVLVEKLHYLKTCEKVRPNC